MWTRKSPDEVAAENARRRRNPLPALVTAILLAFAFTLSKRTGWSGKFTFAIPDPPWAAILASVPWSFLIWFIVLYLGTLIFARNPLFDSVLLFVRTVTLSEVAVIHQVVRVVSHRSRYDIGSGFQMKPRKRPNQAMQPTAGRED